MAQKEEGRTNIMVMMNESEGTDCGGCGREKGGGKSDGTRSANRLKSTVVRLRV
jgi:hypothetical protein